jgi:hypothetical protein
MYWCATRDLARTKAPAEVVDCLFARRSQGWRRSFNPETAQNCAESSPVDLDLSPAPE